MADIRICEMAPRDGLQSLNRESFATTESKLALVDALAAAGIDFIEVGSFVSPRAVPQMADTGDLCTCLTKRADVEYAALVPNMKYYEAFRPSELTTLALFVSATEAYSQFNLRQSIADAMTAAGDVAKAARADGFKLRAHLSAVFQDLDGSDTDVGVVVDLSHRLLEMGCAHVALADTKGTTNPKRVRAVLGEVERKVGLDRMTVHFHDSYGMGVANALVSYDCGVRIFDGSVGGIGGTPFKQLAKGPGGGGNVATEELVFMFEEMGISTGIDFDKLLEAGALVADIVVLSGGPRPPSRMLH